MAEENYISDLLCVIAPLICLAVNVLIQIIWFRLVSAASLLISILSGFVVGLLALLAIHIALPQGETFARLTTNLVIYSALGYCYFHFLNLGETARRIRILRELYETKDGLTLDEILVKYNSKRMVELRLERLLKSGQVLLANGRYYIKSSFLLTAARGISFMKLVVLGKSIEFD